MSHNLAPTLPQELCDMVIDQLSSLRKRRGALTRCCLVSKAWLHRARPYAFRRAKVITRKADRATDESPGPSLRGFAAFLASASGATVRASIMVFTIYGEYNAPPGRGVSLLSLASTLALLPCLDTLALKGARIVGLIDWRHVMPSFKTLTFEDFAKVEGPDTFLRLISLSLRLESVDIPRSAKVFGRCDFGGDCAWPTWSPPKCTSLRNLTIHNVDILDIFARETIFKIQQDTLTSISLEVPVTAWSMRDDMQSPRELISHAALSLEHLSLWLHSSSDDDTGTPYPGLGLAACSSLVTLELELSFTSVCLQAFVCGLLDELFGRAPEHACKLRRIILWAYQAEDLAGIDTALDAHISGETPVRVGLARGSMRAQAGMSPQDRNAFIQAMPRLGARGLLYVYADEDKSPGASLGACAREDEEDVDDESLEETDGDRQENTDNEERKLDD
ncbi:hypothetical protein PsYK624_141030 [Phanerochaete sordida]|uniref:Uncharacterized protein n=1 Tax=Phanerochaete sordida TaxID=48140 RepID=A0A9P3GMT2_9APHY|nr:hypothetical protein PsYK624_141030 [Phanerochaete sordida]